MTFKHQMGLRRLPLAQWLQLDEPRLSQQRAEKARLLTRNHDELFISRDEAGPACEEVLTEVMAARAAFGTTASNTKTSNSNSNSNSNNSSTDAGDAADPDRSLHPLDAAARLIREDLLVHLEVEGTLVLKAGSVCFPTRWVLAEKMDQPLRMIHEPVPGYDTDLGHKVDQFLTRLRPENSVWRQNWSLMPTDDLCLGGRHDYLPIGTEPESLWLRTERQTLRRLPKTGAVLFTIGIDVVALANLDARPAAALADEIESLSAPFANYKGLTQQQAGILRYLRSR